MPKPPIELDGLCDGEYAEIYSPEPPPIARVVLTGNMVRRVLTEMFNTSTADAELLEGCLRLSTPDVQLVERRNVEKDKEQQLECINFVFRRFLREKWGLPSYIQLSLNGRVFLGKRGYVPVAAPQSGDVVAYSGEPPAMLPNNFAHFGILEGGQVISKWGNSHIFKHPISHVPTYYGNQAVFFRKIADTSTQNPSTTR